MNICFIYNGYENLGIEYLSSFLKSQGHKTSLLFDPAVFSGDYALNSRFLGRLLSLEKKIVEKVKMDPPDIVAFSSFTGNFRWCRKIARMIKSKINVPVVFGGVHPSAVPKEVLKNDFIDYVIIGEAEHAFIELIEHLEGKKHISKIRNLAYRSGNKIIINPPRKYIDDLNSLPFLDKELFFSKVPLFQKGYQVLTSRGCPFDCTYCSNNMYHKLYCDEQKHVRRRSPKNVIDELKWAKSKWKIQTVTFEDDVFTFSKDWLKEFIPLYKKEISIPFVCSVHPNTITEEIAYLLKDGGCDTVTMGVQSGSERIRKEIFKRHTSNEKIITSIQSIKKAGIKISVDNIFGAPTETEEDLKEGLKLYMKVKPDRILTFWLTFYPNTQIINIAKKIGQITQKDVDAINQGKIGFTHSGGSIKNRKVYLRYGVLFHLRSLVHNDSLYGLLSPIVVRLPFKLAIIKLIMVLNTIKNKDTKWWWALQYTWSQKLVP